MPRLVIDFLEYGAKCGLACHNVYFMSRIRHSQITLQKASFMCPDGKEWGQQAHQNMHKSAPSLGACACAAVMLHEFHNSRLCVYCYDL